MVHNNIKKIKSGQFLLQIFSCSNESPNLNRNKFECALNLGGNFFMTFIYCDLSILNHMTNAKVNETNRKNKNKN